MQLSAADLTLGARRCYQEGFFALTGIGVTPTFLWHILAPGLRRDITVANAASSWHVPSLLTIY